jgi:hypothetical protein
MSFLTVLNDEKRHKRDRNKVVIRGENKAVIYQKNKAVKKQYDFLI